jgi:hypothetical protein
MGEELDELMFQYLTGFIPKMSSELTSELLKNLESLCPFYSLKGSFREG